MKKIRPFSILFLAVQAILLCTVTLVPGYVVRVLYTTMTEYQRVDFALALLAIPVVIIADVIWSALVLRRYHARHRDRSPWCALAVWAIYLILLLGGAVFGNLFMFMNRSLSAADVVLMLRLLLWGLPPALLLWLPAALASLLDPQYRYRPKSMEPTI